MVTRRWTATLMQLVYNVSYVFESCRRVISPNQPIPVKGDNFVLPMLRQAHQIVLFLSGNVPSLVPVDQDIGNWVASLDRKYGGSSHHIRTPLQSRFDRW